MSVDNLSIVLKKIHDAQRMKMDARKSLEDSVALQLKKQEDNDVLVFNVPIGTPDESRMDLIRRLYSEFSANGANVIAIYPAMSRTDRFDEKTIDKFYIYQRIGPNCFKVIYPRTSMYAIEFHHAEVSHFPELNGQTHWNYLDQFRYEYIYNIN